VDEGGGYYGSGYIQPLDFFGDGTRIPLIAVSPFAQKGLVDHTYYCDGPGCLDSFQGGTS
jgi:Phosphoesterase family